MNSTNMEEKPMKIEIIGRETIKPSSPTLSHNRSLKFCLLDQLGAPSYIPLVLFYPNSDVTTDQRKQKLKDSLSDALNRFYPFAGRIENNNSIECDDNGVPFIEARIHGLLSGFLQHPDMEVLQLFLPIEVESLKAVTTPLLLVQLNFFDCGGLALGLCMSHKFADAASLRTFIRDWTAISLGNIQKLLRAPDFDRAASFFCQRDLSLRLPRTDLKRSEIVSKRFVFDARNITALKAKSVSSWVQRPTRTEAVTALLWRTAMVARRLNTIATRTDPIQYSLVQFVNARKKVEPSLPENSIGNLILYFTTITSSSTATQTDEELQDLVAKLRKGITEFDMNLAKRLGGDDSLELIEEYRKHKAIEERMNVYSCTSWCNFHFYDDADFGWGKPIWMSIADNACCANYFWLMDTKEGDGVEAWVTLSPQDMALFELDHELHSFALSNPGVLG